jgi:hypothetical protein
MFIANIIRGMVNIVALIAALAMLGTLGEMTMDMANKAKDSSKVGFLSISKFNRQLTGTTQSVTD